jgi:hypothetical protein
VLQKTNPFAPIDLISKHCPEANSLFGTSVSQSADNYALLVGAPAAAAGLRCSVHLSAGINVNDYVENTELLLLATGTSGYGCSVDFGNRTWAVAGANTSNSGAGYATILYLIARIKRLHTNTIVSGTRRGF